MHGYRGKRMLAGAPSRWRPALLLIAALLTAPPAMAVTGAETGAQTAAGAAAIGQINSASGMVSIIRGSLRLPAHVGEPLYQSDTIETGADGRAGITFVDNSRFSLGPGGQLALPEFHFDTATQKGGMTADLRHGTLAVVSGAITHTTPGAMHIKTPTAFLGVRGTTFGIEVKGNPPKERFIVFPNPGGGSGAISVGPVAPAAGTLRP